jgi:hypothetical protein
MRGVPLGMSNTKLESPYAESSDHFDAVPALLRQESEEEEEEEEDEEEDDDDDDLGDDADDDNAGNNGYSACVSCA